MESGVYVIRNIINGNEYIGSSKNCAARYRGHKKSLNQKCHHSRYLQRAWNKYGEGAFKFYLLKECELHDLISTEQHFIDKRKPKYNMSPTAGSSLGMKRTDETRLRLRLSHLGKTPWNKGIAISQSQRAKQSEKMKGKPSGAKGIKWSDDSRKKLSLSRTGIQFSDQHKDNLSIQVIRINSLTGEEKFYRSAKLAASENNTHTTNIISVCKGTRKTAGNYRWKYNT